jgi:hypothetical protein
LLIVIPIFLPIILLYAFWVIRLKWVTTKFVEAQTPCLLEIKLPKEITKSPAAMEIFFSYLAFSGPANYGEAFIDGKVRPWSSCEIVSTGGNVRFFIWTSSAKNKNIIEAQLYAQYPNIEVYQVEEKDDYTKDFHFDTEKYSFYGTQYTLTQPDPYPIKTYIDYGLDKDQKDEYKIDPMTSVIEFLGSLKKGNNVWLQILVQKHEKEGWKHGVIKMDINPKKANIFQKMLMPFFGTSRNLKDEVKEEIEKIRKEAIPESDKKDDEKTFKFPNPTKGQNERIAALERSATKTPFDCMIRSIYLAEKDAFNPVNISAMLGCMKQYGSLNLNGFKLKALTDVSDERKDLTRILPFLKPFNNKKIREYKLEMFHAYKLRSFFQHPYKNYRATPFVLTTEELATIFHFPSGLVSQTPTLRRVGSKKSEAPSNLPI